MGETGNGIWDMKGEWHQRWPIIGDDDDDNDDDDDEARASGRGEGNLEQEILKNRGRVLNDGQYIGTFLLSLFFFSLLY